eukprot:2510645-Prymnesium_polylepis.2
MARHWKGGHDAFWSMPIGRGRVDSGRFTMVRDRRIKKRSPAKWTLQKRNGAHWFALGPKKRFRSVTLRFIGRTDGRGRSTA